VSIDNYYNECVLYRTIVKIEFKPSNDESSDDDDKSSDKMMIDS
jgi:hypothetical protein